MTRTFVALLALFCAVVGLAAPAAAQTTAVQCFGPVANSVVCSYTSSTNTTDGTPGTAAAQTIVNASIGTGFMRTQPLHMRVQGYISTSGASGTKSWTLATSWGGNSLTIFNALSATTGVSNAPFSIDCWLVPTSSTAPLAKELTCTARVTLSGTAAAGTTDTVSTQRTTFTLSDTAVQAITVSSTLANIAGLGLVVQRATFTQGD